MKVLVTGGVGFIGSRVTRLLLEEGHEVRICDRARGQIAGAEKLTADLNMPGVAEAAVEGVDWVCHQAAKVGLGVDAADMADYVADNVGATARVLAALSARSFTGRLVLASSMVVYGEGHYVCAKHGLVRPGPRRPDRLAAGDFEPACPSCGLDLVWQTVPEDSVMDPRSVYAVTKLTQEQLCATWARESAASVVALRYHNVYGSGLPKNTPYAGVAALFISALNAGTAPEVYEDGAQMRDFVHVSDVARANRLAFDIALENGELVPFNICSGHPRSVGDIAGALSDLIGNGHLRPVVSGRFRLGDVRHIVASGKNAAEKLGFEAAVTLEDGLAELVGADGPEGADGRSGSISPSN